MQQFKGQFKDSTFKDTLANSQSCIRLNDYDELGDGTHFLYFNMLGLFSFRDWSMQKAIDFWLKFVTEILELEIDYVTIHPEKMEEWKIFYPEKLEIRSDTECIWSDGEMGGYCTEFYVNRVEVGNIVNCQGDSIDAGFGLERLEMMRTGKETSKLDMMKESIERIVLSGYLPSPNKQGYILRKLLRDFVKLGGFLDHPVFYQEVERQLKVKKRYENLKEKHKDKSWDWWYDTHGIKEEDL